MRERLKKVRKTIPYKPGLLQTLAPILDEVATPEQVLSKVMDFPEEDQYNHWLAFAEQGMSIAFGALIQRPPQHTPLRDLQRSMLIFPEHGTAKEMKFLIMKRLADDPLTEDIWLRSKYTPEGFNQMCGDVLKELKAEQEKLGLA